MSQRPVSQPVAGLLWPGNGRRALSSALFWLCGLQSLAVRFLA